MPRKRLLIFLLLIILLIPLRSYGLEEGPRLYLLIVNKLLIEDIKDMKNLEEISREGAVGLINTRGVSGYTGPESFMTINASAKASANFAGMDFEKLGEQIVNKSLNKLIKLNEKNTYSPMIGLLGDRLHERGYKTGVYGNTDLEDMPIMTGALIPMDSQGLIDYGNIDDISLEDEEYPSRIRTDFTRLLEEIEISPADFIVVDTGDLDRLHRSKSGLTDEEYRDFRRKSLEDIDDFIGKLKKTIIRENSLLIITSPNSGDINIRDNKLSPIILWGDTIDGNTIFSATSRRKIIASNMDIGPTIIDFFDKNIYNVRESKIRIIEEDIDLEDIIRENKRINLVSKARYNTLYSYGIFSMLVLSIGIILFFGRINLTGRLKKLIDHLNLLVLILPTVFLLASLFRLETLWGFVSSLALLSLIGLGLVTRKKIKRKAVSYIALVNILIMVLDLLSHGFISRYSVLSHDPIIGARYYGLGNEMTGLFLASLSLLGIYLLRDDKRIRLFLLLFIGCGILTISPAYGANLGGGLAIIAAIIFFLVEYYKIRIGFKRILFMLIGLLSSLLIMGLMDVLFSKNISHLGRTLLIIRDSGLIYFFKTILRKLLMNIKLINRSFWTNLLLLHMILHGLIFYRRKLNEEELIGYISGLGGILAGFLLNDSGLLLASLAMNLITMELYINNMGNKVEKIE